MTMFEFGPQRIWDLAIVCPLFRAFKCWILPFHGKIELKWLNYDNNGSHVQRRYKKNLTFIACRHCTGRLQKMARKRRNHALAGLSEPWRPRPSRFWHTSWPYLIQGGKSCPSHYFLPSPGFSDLPTALLGLQNCSGILYLNFCWMHKISKHAFNYKIRLDKTRLD